MKIIDRLFERKARSLAQHSSRRSMLRGLGGFLVGASALPLLPVAREASAQTGPTTPQEEGDQTSCDYWRYCGMSGALCACCGGSANKCPPGTEMSPLAWIGTCRNPVDGKNYIISYNDCCGKPLCWRCHCQGADTNPGNRPVERPQSSAGYIWCLGSKETSITCTTANVLGVEMDQN